MVGRSNQASLLSVGGYVLISMGPRILHCISNVGMFENCRIHVGRNLIEEVAVIFVPEEVS